MQMSITKNSSNTKQQRSSITQNINRLQMKKQQQLKNLNLRDIPTARDALLLKSQLTSDENEYNSFEMKSVGGYMSRQQSIRSWMGDEKKRKATSRIEVMVVNKVNTGYKASLEQIKEKIENRGIKDHAQQTSYDMWDLTYTLISSKIPIAFTTFLFIIFVLIRYYTFACLVFMAVNSGHEDIMWVLVIIVDRVLYGLLVIKISLETPQTKTEIVLKSHWNSKQSSINQLFQVTSSKKLAISIIRGLIPAQLTFLYIRAQPRRRFQLYAAINYINASIQAVIYYPFFILYCYFLTADNSFALNQYYKGATIGLAIIAEIIMVGVTVTLIFVGLRRRYSKRL